MRTISMIAVVAPVFALFAACGPKQDPSQQPAAAPVAPGAYPQQPAGYPQQGAYPQAAPTYGQQPYPQQPPTQPMPTAAPTSAPTGTTGQMAVPGPVAFQCTNDVPCGTHHCNTQYGKCAFPCQSAADCIPPNGCVMGLCVPQMPQASPGH